MREKNTERKRQVKAQNELDKIAKNSDNHLVTPPGYKYKIGGTYYKDLNNSKDLGKMVLKLVEDFERQNNTIINGMSFSTKIIFGAPDILASKKQRSVKIRFGDYTLVEEC